MKMKYTDISRGILFSLAISLTGCFSEGEKEKPAEETSTESENNEESTDEQIIIEEVKPIDSTVIKGAAFEWNHEFLKDCTAKAGTLGLSFNVDSMYDNINYDMAIEDFQYEELRLLRSIPYAKHGH